MSPDLANDPETRVSNEPRRLPNTSRPLWSQPPLLAGLAAVALVLTVTGVVVSAQSAAHREGVEAAVVREGARIRASLERAIDLRIARTEALVGFATAEAAHGEIDPAAFEQFAAHLQEGSVELRSLQLAPRGVVTYVHPLEGNEEAVGHDLLADPDRRAAVEATVAARATMVAGPFELLQGGTAIVARAPVFIPTADGGEEWWGLATIVADAAPLFDAAALDPTDSFEVAVRGRDGQGAEGEVFLGDAELFDERPELFDITLPAGSWQLAIAPVGGWDAVAWPARNLTIGALTLLGLVLGVLVSRVVASRQRVRRLTEDRAELVATASVPIVHVDADRRIVTWNREATAASGLPATSVLGHDVDDEELVSNDFVRAVASQVEETVRTGVRVEGDIAHVGRADGTVAEFLFNAGPMVDASGRVTDVVVVAQDITSRAEAERIRRDHEALTASARLKDEFLATMSHELRTPLNGIIGITALLREETAGPLNDTQHRYLDHAREASDHLLQLINDVLDISSHDATVGDLDLQPVVVPRVIDQAIRMVEGDARDRGVALRSDATEDIRVIADERRLVQVVLNLLTNAVKFTEQGSVTVTVSATESEVSIAVTDTGIGIRAEDQTRLFQPFVQLDSRLDRRFEGTGLGLALTDRIVRALGGRITVESTLGVGSTFTVALRRAADPVPTNGTDEETAHVTGVTAPPASKPLVLVAEDNDVNRLIVTEYLRALGHDFVTAANGAEAVELARSASPELILMDVQMPTMDGLEATTRLKADPATAHIPIVAVTALAMDGDEERCRAAGCDGYLSKPIKLSELSTTIETLVDAPVE